MRSVQIHAQHIKSLVDEIDGNNPVEPVEADLPRIAAQIAADPVETVHQHDCGNGVGQHGHPGRGLDPIQLPGQPQRQKEGDCVRRVTPSQRLATKDQGPREQVEEWRIGEAEGRRHQPDFAKSRGLFEKVEDHPEDGHRQQCCQRPQPRAARGQHKTQGADRDERDLGQIGNPQRHGRRLGMAQEMPSPASREIRGTPRLRRASGGPVPAAAHCRRAEWRHADGAADG